MADTTIELTRDNPATVVVLSVLLAAEIALAAMHAPMIVIVLVILAGQAFGYVWSRKGHQRRVHISGRLKLVYRVGVATCGFDDLDYRGADKRPLCGSDGWSGLYSHAAAGVIGDRVQVGPPLGLNTEL